MCRKKSIVIVGLLLIVSLFSPVYAEGLSSDKLNVLEAYKIFQGDETGALHLEEAITRAEFCKVICSALGYNDAGDDGAESVYADVEPSHWAYSYIQCAKALQLIDGVGDTLFMPDEPILNQDVIKIIVTALGYEPKAAGLGGYPTGYAAVAAELGLTASKALILSENAIRGDVADMVYTALTVPLMQQTEFGESAQYTIMDGSDGTALVTLKSKLDAGLDVPGNAE